MTPKGCRHPPQDLSFAFAESNLQLERLAEKEFTPFQKVPVNNRSGAQFALHAPSGRRFVIKGAQTPEDIRGEAVGWVLSRALEVKTPAAAVMVESKRLGWASELVPDALPWRAAEASQCSVEDIANIFVLDAIIGNVDRHDDNVLVVDRGGAVPYEVISIDLANSWLGGGAPDGPLVEQSEGVPDDPHFLRGVDAEELVEGASAVLVRARNLAERAGAVEGLVFAANLATGLDSKASCASLADALKVRLANAEALLSAFLDATLRRTYA